jgi:phosphatidylserine/phosphatidylglycerophosphate/cardiolipin synthase-like enzyme
MKARTISVRIFIDIDQVAGKDVSPVAHLAEHCGRFFSENWPFGEPLPRLFYDRRAITPPPPYCSMHAKCVVVDGKRAFVSSANFTDRGQERNIEVGVLIDDPRFAMQLAQQWDGLAKAGIVGEYGVER